MVRARKGGYKYQRPKKNPYNQTLFFWPTQQKRRKKKNKMAFGRRSYQKTGYKRKAIPYKPKYKSSTSTYKSRSFGKLDRFATTRSGVSGLPAPLRRAQGAYSRSAFARVAAPPPLEVKNYDMTNTTNWSLLAATPATAPGDIIAGLAPNAIYCCKGGSLNLVPTGTSANTRDGRKIVVEGIEQHYNFTLASSTDSTRTSMTVRVITLVDTQANGASFDPATLFVSSSYGAYTTAALYNLDNMKRFRILEDKTFELVAQAGIGGTAASVAVQKNFSSKMAVKVPIEFSGTGTPDITNVRANNLVTVILTAGAASTVVTCQGTSRIRYVG